MARVRSFQGICFSVGVNTVAPSSCRPLKIWVGVTCRSLRRHPKAGFTLWVQPLEAKRWRCRLSACRAVRLQGAAGILELRASNIERMRTARRHWSGCPVKLGLDLGVAIAQHTPSFTVERASVWQMLAIFCSCTCLFFCGQFGRFGRYWGMFECMFHKFEQIFTISRSLTCIPVSLVLVFVLCAPLSVATGQPLWAGTAVRGAIPCSSSLASLRMSSPVGHFFLVPLFCCPGLQTHRMRSTIAKFTGCIRLGVTPFWLDGSGSDFPTLCVLSCLLLVFLAVAFTTVETKTSIFAPHHRRALCLLAHASTAHAHGLFCPSFPNIPR